MKEEDETVRKYANKYINKQRIRETGTELQLLYFRFAGQSAVEVCIQKSY